MKRQELLYVIDNKKLNDNTFLMVLGSKTQLPDMEPGQFVQIKVDAGRTLLRRPISIHDVEMSENNFSILVQVVGEGTKALSKLPAGSNVDVIYPLGNSFSMPSNGETSLLVGGGVGIAPLLFLAKRMKSNNMKFDILLGFRDVKRVIEYEKYIEIGKVYTTTEDGSFGVKGFVTDHSIMTSGQYDRVYCCGPEPMMRAVAKLCKELSINCEVSLENKMGCGIGACLCCVTDTINGNVCTCTEGPIFNTNILKW
ncbi:MAG: dihydroorotate dehydrogenase electron transfer subunit [Bacteroidales bacterium]|nr:dihydroorotate dehydrogenase electron transfer subunit [Bacteroidales bacterium]